MSARASSVAGQGCLCGPLPDHKHVMQDAQAAEQRRPSAPSSAMSRSDSAKKGTAESQASTMLPRPQVANLLHTACSTVDPHAAKHSLAVPRMADHDANTCAEPSSWLHYAQSLTRAPMGNVCVISNRCVAMSKHVCCQVAEEVWRVQLRLLYASAPMRTWWVARKSFAKHATPQIGIFQCQCVRSFTFDTDILVPANAVPVFTTEL